MTCIVGVSHEGAVYMGADSGAASGYDVRVRSDAKLFRVGICLIGFTTSFRMGQLLRFKLNTPVITDDQSPVEFMHLKFIPDVRKCLDEGGYLSTVNGREEGGDFLVGVAGHLFHVSSDFQVAAFRDGCHAIGSGYAYALGAMHAGAMWSPICRLKAGLRAAAEFGVAIREPFIFETLERGQ